MPIGDVAPGKVWPSSRVPINGFTNCVKSLTALIETKGINKNDKKQDVIFFIGSDFKGYKDTIIE